MCARDGGLRAGIDRAGDRIGVAADFRRGVELPPLRDRREDIPALAHHFAVKYAAEMRRAIRGVSGEALSLLQTH